MKLLIVDSDQKHRNKLLELGSLWGYECASAQTNRSALEKLGNERFDIVISECNAPEIDGAELGRWLRSPSQDQYIYFIICSEDKSTKSVVQSFDSGADDYISKPYHSEELKARIEAGMRLLSLDRSAKGRLERGLMQAALTLRSMLPRRRDDEHIKTDWLFRPCAIIGGDLFNVIDLDENYICLYAIDVSGHEVAAALFAVTLGHMLLPRRQVDEPMEAAAKQSRFSWNQSPIQVVSTLNGRFQMEPPMNMYATLFYAVIHRKDLTMRWVRAGHPSPIIVRDGKKNILNEGDTPIGVFTDCRFTQHTTQLQKGDRIFLYSDGLPETKHPDTNAMWGSDRLESLISDLSMGPFDSIIPAVDKALLEYRGNDQFDDDLSLLAVEIK